MLRGLLMIEVLSGLGMICAGADAVVMHGTR